MNARAQAVELFRRRYGDEPQALARAPGRVNLIGEHTDYNDGFVLPAAIDRELWLALTASDDGVVEVVSNAFDKPVWFGLDDVGGGARFDGWGAYLQGVAWALGEEGHQLRGWRGAVVSDIPVGAGLSSSAAIELGVARAFHVTSGFPWDRIEMARIARRAENDWVGVATGIMDQIACSAGRAGHALLLDCRTLDITPVPVPEGTRVVVLDTGTRRELSGSAYGDRRGECEAAARQLGVAALRDVTVADVEASAHELDPVARRRVRHVVNENARTLEAADAMRAGDAARLGALMDASHASLRDDFEVSSRELDAIVEAARAAGGCHGSRMTGGGFAGCAVALVEAAAIGEFTAAMTRAYKEATGRDADVHVCVAVDGASHEARAGS